MERDSGRINGLSADLLRFNEKNAFSQCHSHLLKLVVAASCDIQYLRKTFNQIKELTFFFTFSEPLQKILDLSIENRSRLHLSEIEK